MNGYLQRLTLSALQPGGSIQPILGSMFSPPDFAVGPEALPVETEQPIIVHDPSESTPRPDPQPPAEDPGAREFPIPILPICDAGPKGELPAEPVKAPLPAPIRLFTPPFPEPQKKAEPLMIPSPTEQSGNQWPERVVRPERETTPVVPPSEPVEDQVEEMAPARAITRPGNPVRQPADPPGSGPALSVPTAVVAGVPGTRAVSPPAAEPIPGPPVVITARPAARQAGDPPRTELAPGAPASRLESQRLVPSTFGALTPTSGADRKGRMDHLPARLVPDEVQIHIGRIEVVAVAPAPAAPASPKPQRRAPSLDEYLQRRDRRTG
jgi:hypothetical protein